MTNRGNKPSKKIVTTPEIEPIEPKEISLSSDEKKQAVNIDVELSTEIAQSFDTQKVQSPSISLPANIDIATSSDEIKQAIQPLTSSDITIAQSSDIQKIQSLSASQPINTDITASSDEVKQTSQSPVLTNIKIAQSPDTQKIQKPVTSPVTSIEIVQSPDERKANSRVPVAMNTDIANSPDLPYEFIEFPFTGEWIPRGDPLNLKPYDYSTLKNWRYTDYGLEGVGGHTRVNDDNTNMTAGINNGIQLFNHINDVSYVIIQNNDAAGRDIYYSTTAIPDVEAAAFTLAYAGTGTGLGRFSLFPNGHVAMCNQNTNVVWAGKRMRIGAFLGNYNDAAGLDWYTHRDDLTDYTNLVRNNVLADDVTIDDDPAAAIGHTYFVGSPRPLQGLYIKVSVANGADPSTMTINYFDGDDFSNALTIDDGTATGTITLAKDGYVEFTTNPTVYPYLMCGYYLYFYEMTISDTNATTSIYNITLDCDMQDAVDIWDNQYRTAILFYTDASDSKVVNTLEVAEESNQQGEYVANIGGMTNTHEIIVMFEEPQAGFKITMWEDNVNAVVNTVNISTWGEDSAWHAVAPERDSTVDNATRTKPFAKSGFMLLDRPTTTEVATTIDDITGYAYKITVTVAAPLTANTKIDTIQGIPAYRILNKPYIFPLQYQNRAMWCGNISEDEKNRVDYSKANTEAAFNGEDSSGYFNERSLRFGGGDALTCAAEILYHSSNQPTTSALFFKNSETYLLDGYDANTFQIHQLSDDIGCPAPLTIDVSGVIVGRKDAPQRTIAVWMSNSGPMMYYAGVIRPIPGIEPYFERGNSVCIKDSLIDEARGWFDPEYNEYNLSFASGTGATINNKWLVLDLTRMKWYEKNPDASAMFPEGAFPVEDTDGNKYIYGYCASVGYLIRLENGIVWTKTDNTTYDIENEVTTADILSSKSMWDETRLYYLQTIFKCDDDGDITISYYKDGKTTAETVSTLPTARSIASIDFEDAGAVDYRIRHLISYLNLEAWSHRFNFKIANCATASNKPRLLGWGLAYQKRQNSFLDRDELRVITINSSYDELSFTSSQGGPVVLDCADDGSYRIHELVEEFETKLNANGTLTGGVITFTVTLSEGKLKIDAGAGNTIAFTQGQDGDTTFGFRTTQGAAQTITADYYPEEEV